jgi:hypothetical protein
MRHLFMGEREERGRRAATGALPKAVARWLAPEEIEAPRPWPEGLCDGDGCRSTELRISITTHQRTAGEVRRYEHLYCRQHGKLVAVWRNVPIEGTPDGGGSHE